MPLSYINICTCVCEYAVTAMTATCRLCVVNVFSKTFTTFSKFSTLCRNVAAAATTSQRHQQFYSLPLFVCWWEFLLCVFFCIINVVVFFVILIFVVIARHANKSVAFKIPSNKRLWSAISASAGWMTADREPVKWLGWMYALTAECLFSLA